VGGQEYPTTSYAPSRYLILPNYVAILADEKILSRVDKEKDKKKKDNRKSPEF